MATHSKVRPDNPHANLPYHVYDIRMPSQVPPPAAAPDGAGDGAAKSERQSPTTSHSTNIPMPDNRAGAKSTGDHGKGVF